VLLFFLFASIPFVLAAPAAGTPHYHDSFNPDLKPWQSSVERNIEEVYQRFEYFKLVYSEAGGRITVTRYLRGKQAEVGDYYRQPDGSLLPVVQDIGIAASSTLYATHCAVCHGADRLGGSGPALLPSNLQRLRKQAAGEVIRNGRTATQMPPFSSTSLEHGRGLAINSGSAGKKKRTQGPLNRGETVSLVTLYDLQYHYGAFVFSAVLT